MKAFLRDNKNRKFDIFDKNIAANFLWTIFLFVFPAKMENRQALSQSPYLQYSSIAVLQQE